MSERMLVLMRHGQSQGNLDNVFTGWLDLPLTEVGRLQAMRMGQTLKEKGIAFDAAFSSALGRAEETCRLVLQRTGKPGVSPVAAAALNERDYGELTGMDKDEARHRWGADMVAVWRRSYDVAPPGGESLRDTLARSLPFFTSAVLPGILMGNTTLVVAHGNSLRALTMTLEGLTEDEVEDREIGTGEAAIYAFTPDGRAMLSERLYPDNDKAPGNHSVG